MHLTLRQPGDKARDVHPTRARRAVVGWLRAIFGGVAAASILTAAIGCDKRAQGEPPPRVQTSLAGKPTVLFLLFGDRTDPRLLPVATLGHGNVTPITLDANGWRNFDQLYFKTGGQVAVYRGGDLFGNASVRRGMWEGREALYSLPGCRSLRPLAAVSLPSAPDVASLEMVGTSDPLPAAPAHPQASPAYLDSARAVAARVAKRGGFAAGGLDDLELAVQAFHTGATGRPTLAATYIERGAENSPHPRHLFILADSAGAGGDYASSFTYLAKDSVAEFRRVIDHVDLTGDGVDEIVLEGWRNGGDSFLVVMKYGNGKWHEIARGTNSWCADPPKL
jgi:hypothetical protein